MEWRRFVTYLWNDPRTQQSANPAANDWQLSVSI